MALSSKEKAAPVHQRSAEEWASHCTQLLRGLADAMFASTKRFRSAVELVNGLEPKPLMKILGRLLAALPDKVRAKSIVTVDPFFARAFLFVCMCCVTVVWAPAPPAPSQGATVFSEAETAQMRELFALDADQLDILLGGCNFIFEQAAYATTAPEALSVELIGAGVSEPHANAFAATWQAGAADVVRRLKDAAVLAPSHLTGVDWQLCVGTAGSGGERGQSAHTMLELELSTQQPPGAGGGGSGGATQKVHLRLGREGMVDLLGKLDKIQAQIDKLS